MYESSSMIEEENQVVNPRGWLGIYAQTTTNPPYEDHLSSSADGNNLSTGSSKFHFRARSPLRKSVLRAD